MTLRQTVLHRRDVQRVARYRDLKVNASPVGRGRSTESGLWRVEIEGLNIANVDLGIDGALAGLANQTRARVPALLYRDGREGPPPERQLSLLVQLRIADQEGNLVQLLRNATRVTKQEI